MVPKKLVAKPDPSFVLLISPTYIFPTGLQLGQGSAGRKMGNTLKRRQHKQISVAGNDAIRFSCQCGLKEFVVLGVAKTGRYFFLRC